MLAQQNVDIESSFASSKLPEEKRSVEKQVIKANLFDSVERSEIITNPMAFTSLYARGASSSDLDLV